MFKVKKVVKSVLVPFYRLFNFFFLPVLKNYYFSRIEKIPRTTQLFFMTRFDLGPCLLHMHYAECWHQERGPACLVVFTTHMNKVVKLAKHVCPNVKIIHFDNLLSRILIYIFKNEIVQFYTLIRIYAYACIRWPHALYIYDMNFSRHQRYNVSCYVPIFDPILTENWPFSEEFRRVYLHVRQFMDYRRPVFQDMVKLHYQCAQKKLVISPSTSQRPDSDDLWKKLKIENPYVVMNLNCKIYRYAAQNYRRINFPERYNPMIDFLITKGYTVVMQGRKEQPSLAPRKGLIEYFNSPEISSVNDFKLFDACSFAVCCKTGPEHFCSISHIPVLGLNYIELSCISPNGRCRFFPKHLWDRKKEEFIHWRDLLKRPCFYDIGYLAYEDEVDYIDLDAEEMLKATREFLALVPKPFSSWLQYTPLQQELKQLLHPAHLDLYDAIDVPCDAYLSSRKYR